MLSDTSQTVTSQPSREADTHMTQKISFREWVRGNVKDIAPAATYCEGSHKRLDKIENYIGGRGKCGFCWKDMKPNAQGWAPKHPPSRMKFTFKIKYPDVCQIGSHPVAVGTKCRYFGVKLVCVNHI